MYHCSLSLGIDERKASVLNVRRINNAIHRFCAAREPLLLVFGEDELDALSRGESEGRRRARGDGLALWRTRVPAQQLRSTLLGLLQDSCVCGRRRQQREAGRRLRKRRASKEASEHMGRWRV